MNDFVNGGWSVFIAVVSVVSILSCAVLLWKNGKQRVSAKPEQTGHVWDEDLAEWNNPLPRWWVGLFYLTIVLALVYLMFFPGLGTFAGILGWSSQKQYEAEDAKAQARYEPIFAKFMKQDIKTIATTPEAHKMGQRLFLTYCSQCHGSDAKGSRGFPNLTDSDWLWGGEPEKIRETILNGRAGVMPPMGPSLGEAGVKAVANYVLSLSGSKHDAALAEKGKESFTTICAACHGADGKGSQALGAPNLTDKIWLYGGSEATLIQTITKGRTGQMPAHRATLGPAKTHLLAGYVYGLSHANSAQ